MKTKQITAYFCDHCNKLYQRKHFVPAHEKSCKNNPDNKRACDTCRYLTIKDHTLFSDNGFTEWETEVACFFCEKKNHFVYPYKVEHKGSAFDDMDFENEPMPRVCGYPLIDKAIIFSKHGIISELELKSFERLAVKEPEIGQQLFNGFDQRPKPESFLPF